MTSHRIFCREKRRINDSYEIVEIFVQGCCKQLIFRSKSKRLTSKQILIKCMKFERPHAVSVGPLWPGAPPNNTQHQTNFILQNIKHLFCSIVCET